MKKLDMKYLVGGIGCSLLAFGMMQGKVQQVISFEDPLNEIFFTVMALMGAVGMFACIKKA